MRAFVGRDGRDVFRPEIFDDLDRSLRAHAGKVFVGDRTVAVRRDRHGARHARHVVRANVDGDVRIVIDRVLEIARRKIATRVDRSIRDLRERAARHSEIVSQNRNPNPHGGGSSAALLIISPRILLATNKNGNDTKRPAKPIKCSHAIKLTTIAKPGRCTCFDVRRGFK